MQENFFTEFGLDSSSSFVNRKCICSVYWFSPRLSTMFQRNQPLRGCSENKYFQNSGNLFVKYLRRISYISQLTYRIKACDCIQMNSFINILRELCPDLLCWILFWIFQNTYLSGSLSTTAYYACRNCWKSFWLDSPKAFINDIPPK